MGIRINAVCDYRGEDWPHMTCPAGLTIWADPGQLEERLIEGLSRHNWTLTTTEHNGRMETRTLCRVHSPVMDTGLLVSPARELTPEEVSTRRRRVETEANAGPIPPDDLPAVDTGL